MRTVFAAVIGIMLIGLTATTSLAIKGTSGDGKVWGKARWKIRRERSRSTGKVRFENLGRGTAAFATGDTRGFMGVESMLSGLSGEPRGGAFFGGFLTVTAGLDRGDGPALEDFKVGFKSISIPWRRDPGDNGTRVNIGNRSIVLSDTIGMGMGEFINCVSGAPAFTDSGGLEQFARVGKRRVRAVTEIGGTIIPTSIRTSGSLSVDRRTFSRYRGRAVLRYKGFVSGGPNSGAEVLGTVSLRAKGSRAP